MTTGEPLIVLGDDDAADLMRRAAASYAPSLRPTAGGGPGIRVTGATHPQPLLDDLYGGLHVVRFTSGPDGRTIEHMHDCDQVIVVTGGAPYVEYGEVRHSLVPGNVVLIRAGVAHVHGAGASGAETVVLTRTGHSTDPV